MRKLLLTLMVVLISSINALAQFTAPTEGWIAVPGSSANGYGVYVFQRDFDYEATGKTMKVWVTGDNRYKLFVNGQIASIGPARSDLQHWNCEEVDLAPYLHNGQNTIAALVWNEGGDRPVANITYRTGFLLRAIDSAASFLNTDSRWLCRQDKSYSPAKVVVAGYYAAGPGERVDMHKRSNPALLKKEGALNGNAWQKAEVISGINYVGQSGAWGTYPGWMIKKSELPQRELKLQRLNSVRLADNVKVGKGFLSGKEPVTVHANTTARLIIDNKTLTNAYFTLNFNSGDNSRITIGYSEALYNESLPKGNLAMVVLTKGDRNEIEGKHFIGRSDTIISNGKDGQSFTTLSWRTYRYIVLTIKTADKPLTINDIYGTFTGFPFELKASLNTNDRELNDIFNVGWRTARLCAIETFMDCPYYEQMQYFGDSRIQALISLYMTGDDRLVKQLLNAADWSRNADGVTQSRYPASLQQWIQPYALHYIYTLHDYMMYAADTAFLKTKLMAERTILDYFHRYQTADGRVKNLPGWNFTDWVDNNQAWKEGVALPGADGSNAVMDLQLLYAYQMAADMEARIGMREYAEIYNRRAAQLSQTIKSKYWQEGKGLYSDCSDKDVFSQHTNALAILTGIAEGEKAKNIARLIESDSTLAPASIYFKFYTHQAMTKAGLGDDYLSWLGIWRQYLKLGMTTWGETSDVNGTRSECHAWGASPNIELFRTVLGIQSDDVAFKSVAIEPHLGTIKAISGTMPTPYGNITVEYKVKGSALNATIDLPEGMTGNFKWKNNNYLLHNGKNVIFAH